MPTAKVGQRKPFFEELYENVEYRLLNEAEAREDPDKPLTLSGTALRIGEVTRNRRLYKMSVMQKAVKKAQNLVRQGKFLGQVDHPWNARGSLSDAALRFTKLEIEGDLLVYEAVTLRTEQGKHLKTLLLDGVRPGVSLRGWGSVSYETLNGVEVEVVQDDYELFGIDAVLFESSPSGKINKFEGLGGITVKNWAEFKEAQPDLAAQLESELRGAITAELQSEHEKALAKAKDDGMKEAMESVEVKGLREKAVRAEKLESVINTVAEALKTLGVEVGQISESEVQKQIKSLEEQVANLTAERDQARAEANELKVKLETIETKANMQAKLDEMVKGHKFEATLRERLGAKIESGKITDEASLKESFDEIVSLLESATAQKPDTNGSSETGKVLGESGDEDPKPTPNLIEGLDLDKIAKLAGIDEE